MDILDNKQLTPFFGSKKVKIGVFPPFPTDKHISGLK
jgi:hypothetical protein